MEEGTPNRYVAQVSSFKWKKAGHTFQIDEMLDMIVDELPLAEVDGVLDGLWLGSLSKQLRQGQLVRLKVCCCDTPHTCSWLVVLGMAFVLVAGVGWSYLLLYTGVDTSQ